jgi:regulator of replication initiation timing
MQVIRFTENGCLTTQTLEKIASLERQAKAIKEQQEEIRKALLKAMEETGTVKFESDIVNITYVDPTVRETFDTKTFKKENPEEYDRYVKFSPVKASIRITIK